MRFPAARLAVLLATVSACATTTPAPGLVAPLMTTQGPDGTMQEVADLDGNGQPDVWTAFREVRTGKDNTQRVLIRKAADLNGDGRVDVQTAYDDRGDPLRQDLDLDFDGRGDKVRWYKRGAVEREDICSRFDGHIDVRKFYEDGALVVKQVDTTRTGRFDEFQYFVGGKLSRIGWDRDGDGKPELFEENPALGD
jgi:hypothetical protein